MSDPIAELRATLAEAINAAGGDASVMDRVALDPPKDLKFGDLATNAALVSAGSSGLPPRDFAAILGKELEAKLGDSLASWDVAGPGFLNLTLGDAWYLKAAGSVVEAGGQFGSGGSRDLEKVIVEFVSANPTGPLTAAGGRHAAYGDSLARILEFHGNTVDREYYINDAGAQIQRLGLSIIARANGTEVPEDGYSGDYIIELASQIPGAADEEPAEVAQAGIKILVAGIASTLERYGVSFDHWFSEATLHGPDGSSQVTKTCDALQRGGHAFSEDGALWLRTTDLGDDKDRVLVRSDGEPTYFAADIAYHADKLSRGERLIDVWGADHHGYVARMTAAIAALGEDPARLEMVIMQFVNLVEGGTRSQMSKRRGDFVTLDDLLDEIGVDAARWFMLQRSHDTTVDLDLDLARDSSAENPVYYVQYAHARAFSVIAKAGVGVPAIPMPAAELHESEKQLIRRLVSWPAEVAEAATRRAPHRICAYALVLSQEFTAFYRDCRIIGATDTERDFRLVLAAAAQAQIATALGLLGVSAPNEL
ncbi:MAG: arginine--tRNA ligase [Solirubrobacterales bacterium]|nr:arginine--tRNA ligase [Solirubrobacterales bacterium]